MIAHQLGEFIRAARTDGSAVALQHGLVPTTSERAVIGALTDLRALGSSVADLMATSRVPDTVLGEPGWMAAIRDCSSEHTVQRLFANGSARPTALKSTEDMIRDLIGAYDRVGSIETCLIRSSSPDGVLVNASGSFPTVPAEPRTTLEELTLACGERELWHGGHGLGHQSGRSASGEEIGGPPFVRLGVTVTTSKARADHWQPRRTWDEPALHALRIPSFARELLREVKELKRIVERKDVDAHLQRADQEKDPEPVVRGAMFPSRDATEILLRYEPEKGFPLTIWASGVAPRSLKQPPPQVEGVLMKALTVAMEARRGSVPSVSYRGHFEPQSLQIRPGGSRQQFLDWWEEFISRGQPLVPSGKKDIYLVSWRMALSPSQ